MSENRKKVTVIIPAYNEAAALPSFYAELTAVCRSQDGYAWEYLFIDDGSTDETLHILKRLQQDDAHVSYVSLSRNFGKENAMLAGFDYAQGDCCIVMDADLQHPPTLIPDMLRLWQEGYEDIYACRRNRDKEGLLRRKLSELFYKLLDRSTNFEVLPNVGDFRLLDRKCIDALRRLRETERYTKGMFCWIGYRKRQIVFDCGDRVAGKSTWSYRKLFALAVKGITSYTTAPLRVSTLLGFCIAGAAFLYMLYFLVKTILYGDEAQGFPTLIIIILFLGGIQLISLGIIGEYLAAIFNETKRRPVYLTSEYSGTNDNQEHA